MPIIEVNKSLILQLNIWGEHLQVNQYFISTNVSFNYIRKRVTSGVSFACYVAVPVNAPPLPSNSSTGLDIKASGYKTDTTLLSTQTNIEYFRNCLESFLDASLWNIP